MYKLFPHHDRVDVANIVFSESSTRVHGTVCRPVEPRHFSGLLQSKAFINRTLLIQFAIGFFDCMIDFTY